MYPSAPPPQPLALRTLPALPQMYAPSYQPQQQLHYAPAPPAARQRTAIACRYCRRRKVRCSGFDHSEDGRCTNCQRLSRQCVFTPVSARAHAFVPAHMVWRRRNPPLNAPLFGAYGQALLQHGNRELHLQPQQSFAQCPLPSPQGYEQTPIEQQQPPPPQVGAGERRLTGELREPTLPPLNPSLQAGMQHSLRFLRSPGNPCATAREATKVDAFTQTELWGHNFAPRISGQAGAMSTP